MQEDRRIRRTKKMLMEGLIHLLKEKPLKHITVRELTETAGINRGTFYLHYKDVYDLMEQMQDAVLEEFTAILSAHEAQPSDRILFPLLEDICKLLAENAELIQCLIHHKEDAMFTEKLKAVIRQWCLMDMHLRLEVKNDDDFAFFYHYAVTGFIGILQVWFADGMQKTPQEIAWLTERLILHGAAALR